MAFVGPHHGPKILGKNHQSTTKVTLNEPPMIRITTFRWGCSQGSTVTRIGIVVIAINESIHRNNDNKNIVVDPCGLAKEMHGACVIFRNVILISTNLFQKWNVCYFQPYLNCVMNYVFPCHISIHSKIRLCNRKLMRSSTHSTVWCNWVFPKWIL